MRTNPTHCPFCGTHLATTGTVLLAGTLHNAARKIIAGHRGVHCPLCQTNTARAGMVVNHAARVRTAQQIIGC